MNIYELFESWGVDYSNVKNNGGNQAQLFVYCGNCKREFTNNYLLNNHICTTLTSEKLQFGKFRELYCKKTNYENDFPCLKCEKNFTTMSKLIIHCCKKHKKNTISLYKYENWYFEAESYHELYE